MPLLKCPDCNNDISDKAVICPHCGAAGQGFFRAFEYRSKKMLFGLPLVHIVWGPAFNPVTGRMRIAKGIIAIGGVAVGVLAMGGLAFGVIALGGAAVGLAALGGAALGIILAIGGFAVGFVTLGGAALIGPSFRRPSRLFGVIFASKGSRFANFPLGRSNVRMGAEKAARGILL